MMNVCARCGQYRPDKLIDPAGPYAICPECGHRHPFRQMPLLIVSGASGAGKSAVCRALLGTLDAAIPLEMDLLWRPEFNKPDEHYRDFFETWLRMSKNIGQSGRPVVLFGAGAGVPENVEPCVERRYFSTLHYLALTCDPEVLAARLEARPAWRESGDRAFIDTQIAFNAWFRDHAGQSAPVIDLLDTTSAAVEDTAGQVAQWIHDTIETHPNA